MYLALIELCVWALGSIASDSPVLCERSSAILLRLLKLVLARLSCEPFVEMLLLLLLLLFAHCRSPHVLKTNQWDSSTLNYSAASLGHSSALCEELTTIMEAAARATRHVEHTASETAPGL